VRSALVEEGQSLLEVERCARQGHDLPHDPVEAGLHGGGGLSRDDPAAVPGEGKLAFEGVGIGSEGDVVILLAGPVPLPGLGGPEEFLGV
jgi:hypothetical protein